MPGSPPRIDVAGFMFCGAIEKARVGFVTVQDSG
jgi:hypothetical protein